MGEQGKDHDDAIIEQFSRQAIPFTRLPGHLSSIDLLIELAAPQVDDTALDVACGPGLVACAFAQELAHIEGIDITAKMIDAARERQRQLGLTNMSWRVGNADPLPYADDSFDVIVSRYSFHHLLQPSEVLSEMVRVCRPGGRVLVADVVQPAAKATAYDRLEKIRDPSHTRVLMEGQVDDWFGRAGLIDCRQAGYDVHMEVEAQLAASFPEVGSKARLREMFAADIGVNALGINARRVGGEIHYTVPIRAFVGYKAPL